MTRPPELEDPTFARSCVEAWIPNRAERRAVLGGLAQSIDEAHDLTPSCWGLSLLPKDQRIRLNVGMVNMVVLGSSGRHMLLVNPEKAVDMGAWDDKVANYKNAPNSVALSIPGAKWARAYETERQAHFDCIAQAARRKSGYLWPERHSPGLLEFISEFLGIDLPAPEYADPAILPPPSHRIPGRD